jgi:hypothetical protein
MTEHESYVQYRADLQRYLDAERLVERVVEVAIGEPLQADEVARLLELLDDDD